jgi:ankyrin repeat protein
MRFALIKAAAVGHSCAVASLLDAGVCKKTRGSGVAEVQKLVSLVFSIAAERSQLGVCSLLLEHKMPFQPGTLDKAVMSAARNPQSVQLLQLLLEKGQDINIGKDGFDYITPLGRAISASNVEGVRLLLQHGASVQPTTYSKSPLYYAVQYKTDLKLVRLLIKHGAKDSDYSAVKEATLKAQWDVVEVLMKASPAN